MADKISGLKSETNIIKRRDKKMAERTAEEIMNKEVITITRDRSILELAELFIKNNISGVPVVDKENTLQGIVSETDIVNFVKKDNTSLLYPVYSYAFIPPDL